MPIKVTESSYVRPPDKDQSSEAETLRSRFRWLVAIWGVVFISAPLAAIYLGVKGNTVVQPAVKLSNGVMIAGQMVAPKITKEIMAINAIEIISALFCWTDKGGVEEVKPYVHEVVWADMARRMQPVTTRKQVYEQQLVINPEHLVFTGGASGVFVTFKLRGVLVSKGIVGYAENELFYQVRFRRAPADKIAEGNGLGWYLTDLRKMESSEFYKDIIKSEVDKATKVESIK